VIDRIKNKVMYYAIYQIGVRMYRSSDGTVDWDEITLGEVLDRLSR
jgi:hypothetical protein